MKTYREGTPIVIGEQRWQVTELEWVPPHQRLQVRMTNEHGDELALTPHELAINGARNG